MSEYRKLLLRKEWGGALRILESLVAKNPTNSLYCKVIMLAVQLRDYDKVEDYTLRQVVLNPSYQEKIASLLKSDFNDLARNRDWDQALKAVNLLIHYENKFTNKILCAKVQMKMEDWDAARVALEKLHEEDVRNIEVIQLLEMCPKEELPPAQDDQVDESIIADENENQVEGEFGSNNQPLTAGEKRIKIRILESKEEPIHGSDEIEIIEDSWENSLSLDVIETIDSLDLKPEDFGDFSSQENDALWDALEREESNLWHDMDEDPETSKDFLETIEDWPEDEDSGEFEEIEEVPGFQETIIETPEEIKQLRIQEQEADKDIFEEEVSFAHRSKGLFANMGRGLVFSYQFLWERFAFEMREAQFRKERQEQLDTSKNEDVIFPTEKKFPISWSKFYVLQTKSRNLLRSLELLGEEEGENNVVPGLEKIIQQRVAEVTRDSTLFLLEKPVTFQIYLRHLSKITNVALYNRYIHTYLERQLELFLFETEEKFLKDFQKCSQAKDLLKIVKRYPQWKPSVIQRYPDLESIYIVKNAVDAFRRSPENLMSILAEVDDKDVSLRRRIERIVKRNETNRILKKIMRRDSSYTIDKVLEKAKKGKGRITRAFHRATKEFIEDRKINAEQYRERICFLQPGTIEDVIQFFQIQFEKSLQQQVQKIRTRTEAQGFRGFLSFQEILNDFKYQGLQVTLWKYSLEDLKNRLEFLERQVRVKKLTLKQIEKKVRATFRKPTFPDSFRKFIARSLWEESGMNVEEKISKKAVEQEVKDTKAQFEVWEEKYEDKTVRNVVFRCLGKASQYLIRKRKNRDDNIYIDDLVVPIKTEVSKKDVDATFEVFLEESKTHPDRESVVVSHRWLKKSTTEKISAATPTITCPPQKVPEVVEEAPAEKEPNTRDFATLDFGTLEFMKGLRFSFDFFSPFDPPIKEYPSGGGYQEIREHLDNLTSKVEFDKSTQSFVDEILKANYPEIRNVIQSFTKRTLSRKERETIARLNTSLAIHERLLTVDRNRQDIINYDIKYFDRCLKLMSQITNKNAINRKIQDYFEMKVNEVLGRKRDEFFQEVEKSNNLQQLEKVIAKYPFYQETSLERYKDLRIIMSVKKILEDFHQTPDSLKKVLHHNKNILKILHQHLAGNQMTGMRRHLERVLTKNTSHYDVYQALKPATNINSALDILRDLNQQPQLSPVAQPIQACVRTFLRNPRTTFNDFKTSMNFVDKSLGRLVIYLASTEVCSQMEKKILRVLDRVQSKELTVEKGFSRLEDALRDQRFVGSRMKIWGYSVDDWRKNLEEYARQIRDMKKKKKLRRDKVVYLSTYLFPADCYPQEVRDFLVKYYCQKHRLKKRKV